MRSVTLGPQDWNAIEDRQQRACRARARGDFAGELSLLEGCLSLMIEHLRPGHGSQGPEGTGLSLALLGSAWACAAPASRERAALVSLAGQFGVDIMMMGDGPRALEPLTLAHDQMQEFERWLEGNRTCTCRTVRQETQLLRRFRVELPTLLAEAYNAVGQTTLAAGLTVEIDAIAAEPTDESMYALTVYLTLALNLVLRLQHQGQIQRASAVLESRCRLQPHAPRWMREILAAKRAELAALTAGRFLEARDALTLQLGWFRRSGFAVPPGIIAGSASDQMSLALRAGRWDLALADAARVLVALQAGGQEAQATVWRTFAQLAESAEAEGTLWSAALFRKLAVDCVHRVGLRLARAAPDLAGESDDEAELLHDELARTLIELARVAEAAEVIQLRFSGEPSAPGPSLTNAEAHAASVIREALESASPSKQNRGMSGLLERVAGIAGISPKSTIGLTVPERALAVALADAAQISEQGGAERDTAVLRLNAALRERGASSLPAAALQNTAQLFIIVARRGVTAVIRTGGGQCTISLPGVDSAWINRYVLDTLKIVADPRLDPREQLKDGWTRLVCPLLSRLEGVERLLIAAPGALHSLPWGALYDGERYLVERFCWVRVASPDVDLRREPTPRPKFAGFAATHAADGLPALGPAVSDEVNAGRNLWGGTTFVDHEYTAPALRSALTWASVVHIASHFVAIPGSLERSTLLLGDGRVLTLAQFLESDLTGVDMMMLSACNTGLVSGAAATEGGFAIDVALLTRGARAAITTLWSVDSAATGALVTLFYQHLRAGNGKDAALASAQRAAISGALGGGRLRPPAFWASLALSGNFLGFPEAAWSHP